MVTIDHNNSEKTMTCTFSNRLDTIASIQIVEEINNQMASIRGINDVAVLADVNIIFDLTDVVFISSSFIRICVGTSKQVQSGNFCIMNCDPFIKKTFKIAGLDGILNVT